MSTNPLLAFSSGLAGGFSQSQKVAQQGEQRKQEQQTQFDLQKKIEETRFENDKKLKAMDLIKEGIKTRNASLINAGNKLLGGDQSASITFDPSGKPLAELKTKVVNKDTRPAISKALSQTLSPEHVADVMNSLEDGSYVSYDPITNKMTLEDAKKANSVTELSLDDGIAINVIRDGSGKVIDSKKLDGLYRTVSPPGVKRSQKEAELIPQTIAGFTKVLQTDALLKDMSKQQAALTRLDELIAIGDTNQLAATAIAFTFPRAFGEVGNLTKDEKDAWKSGASFLRKAEQMIQSMAKGTLTPDNIKDMNEVVQKAKDTMKTMATLKVKSIQKSTSEGLKGMSGYKEADSETLKNMADQYLQGFGITADEEEGVRDANTGTSENEDVIGEDDFLKKYGVK